jgi:hypothetical protein
MLDTNLYNTWTAVFRVADDSSIFWPPPLPKPKITWWKWPNPSDTLHCISTKYFVLNRVPRSLIYFSSRRPKSSIWESLREQKVRFILGGGQCRSEPITASKGRLWESDTAIPREPLRSTPWNRRLWPPNYANRLPRELMMPDLGARFISRLAFLVPRL